MISNPLVTVIITTCSRPELFKRALLSVFEQTYKNLEIIVIDDTPLTDLQILDNQKYTEGLNGFIINYYRTGGKKGPALSRNLGIENSNGDFIAFLDDDDYWLPEKIQLQLNHFKEFDAILSGCFFITQDKIKKSFENPKGYYSKYDLYLGGRAGGEISSFMVRKEVIKEINFIDLFVSEDQLLFASILFSGRKIGFLNNHLVYKDISSQNSLSNINKGFANIQDLKAKLEENSFIGKGFYYKVFLCRQILGVNLKLEEFNINRLVKAFKFAGFASVLVLAFKMYNFLIRKIVISRW